MRAWIHGGVGSCSEQCFDLSEQESDEVMDFEINSYVVHDMTTTDTYSSDFDWMVRGISQPPEARPSGWIRGMVMLPTVECACRTHRVMLCRARDPE